MSSTPYGYSVVVESQDVVVRLNKDVIDRDAMTRFLDYLELELIRKRSKLTQERADALAAEIDRDVWENLKPKFLKEQ
jgi:hypothetical protein